MIEAVNPKNQKLKFHEDRHLYIDDDDVRYTSVTTLVHNLFPSFDGKRIAQFCVKNKKSEKYFGRKVDDVLLEWKQNGIEAAKFGTRVHLYAHNMLTGKPQIVPESDDEAKFFKSISKFINELVNKYELIESEHIVFSKKFRVSGTIDLIMRNKETGNICIFDWKTNKSIDKENTFETAFPPIQHLSNCNFNHYSLQLNIYKTICALEGYFSGNFEMALFHVKKTKINIFEVPPLNREIRLIFKELI